MNKNKSFILYKDLIHTVAQLPDEIAGKLFKHILSYVNGEEVNNDDILINIAFEPIKQHLLRNNESYEATCIRNKKNGSKGGRPKKEQKNQEKPKKPTRIKVIQKKAKKPDSDIDIDSGIDKYTSKELKPIFLRWLKYKKEKKQMYKSEDSKETCYNKLVRFSSGDESLALEIIDQAIGNNWAGFFPLDEKNKKIDFKEPEDINEVWNNE